MCIRVDEDFRIHMAHSNQPLESYSARWDSSWSVWSPPGTARCDLIRCAANVHTRIVQSSLAVDRKWNLVYGCMRSDGGSPAVTILCFALDKLPPRLVAKWTVDSACTSMAVCPVSGALVCVFMPKHPSLHWSVRVFH